MTPNLPPGTSLNESLEWRTLVYRFPNADPTNKGQKGVDFTEGAHSEVETVLDPTTKIETLQEVRTGGKWIQNKLLDPVKETAGIVDAGDALRRVNKNVALAIEKLHSQLQMPRAITKWSNDDSKYFLDLRKPESVLIHLEVPGIERHPELKGALEAAANDLVGRYDNEGLPVRVEINEPPPSGTLESLGSPVSDLALSADEFALKYRVATTPASTNPLPGADERATGVRIGVEATATERPGVDRQPAAGVDVQLRVATKESAESATTVPVADEPPIRVRVDNESAIEVPVAVEESASSAGTLARALETKGSLVGRGLLAVTEIGVGLGISYLLDWQQHTQEAHDILEEAARIKPEIQSGLNALGPQLVDLQLNDPATRLYARVTVTTQKEKWEGPGTPPPHMTVDSVTADTKYEEQKSAQRIVRRPLTSLAPPYHSDTLSYSIELKPFGKHELREYLLREIAQEEQAGRESSAAEDTIASQRHRDELREKLRKLEASDQPSSSQSQTLRSESAEQPAPDHPLVSLEPPATGSADDLLKQIQLRSQQRTGETLQETQRRVDTFSEEREESRKWQIVDNFLRERVPAAIKKHKILWGLAERSNTDLGLRQQAYDLLFPTSVVPATGKGVAQRTVLGVTVPSEAVLQSAAEQLRQRAEQRTLQTDRPTRDATEQRVPRADQLGQQVTRGPFHESRFGQQPAQYATVRATAFSQQAAEQGALQAVRFGQQALQQNASQANRLAHQTALQTTQLQQQAAQQRAFQAAQSGQQAAARAAQQSAFRTAQQMSSWSIPQQTAQWAQQALQGQQMAQYSAAQQAAAQQAAARQVAAQQTAGLQTVWQQATQQAAQQIVAQQAASRLAAQQAAQLTAGQQAVRQAAQQAAQQASQRAAQQAAARRNVDMSHYAIINNQRSWVPPIVLHPPGFH